MEVIRQHPHFGAEILRPIAALKNLAPTVFHHQEFWNGKGYPSKIGKREIPMAARLISVAEAYDVMTAEIPFRKQMTINQALATLKAESGRQFDPEMAEAFQDVIKNAEGKQPGTQPFLPESDQ